MLKNLIMHLLLKVGWIGSKGKRSRIDLIEIEKYIRDYNVNIKM